MQKRISITILAAIILGSAFAATHNHANRVQSANTGGPAISRQYAGELGDVEPQKKNNKKDKKQYERFTA